VGQDDADDAGNAFRELRSVKLFPCVGMKKLPQVHLTANFGQQPFVFDIDGMVKVCMFRRHLKPADPPQKEKFTIHSEVHSTSTANLQPPLDEGSLFQELIAQFLAHDGYVETARAFAEEVAAESASLENGREPLKYEVEEDVEAVNRQSMSLTLYALNATC
jgi:hypothetical protein